MDSSVPAEPLSGKSGSNSTYAAEDRPKPLAGPQTVQGKQDHKAGEAAARSLVGASLLHPDRIAKNTSYLTVALIIQKILSLAYFIYISRAVGPQQIGSYLTALAITTVLGFFIDLNYSQALIREIAKRPEKTHDYLNTAITIKTITAVLAYLVAQLYASVFQLPEIVRFLVIISGLVMVLDSLTLTFYSVFRGHQRLHYEAIGTILNKVVVVCVGVVGVQLGFGLFFLVCALLVGSLLNVTYSGILLMRKLRWRPRLPQTTQDFRFLTRIVVPWFTLGGIFITVYGYLDQLLLSNPLLVGDKGSSYLSWYGTAYKLTFAFQFLPAAVVAAVFPAMSAYYVSNRELLAKTFARSIFYLLLLAIPLSFGIFALADIIVVSAYTKVFASSILPLQILIISLVFIFLNYPIGYLLNAADRQRRNTIHVGIVMVVNLALNLFLIPRYNFVGAAVASTLSSAILVGLGFFVARKIIPINHRFLLVTAAKIIIAAGSMGALLLLLKDRLHIFLLIPIGVVWYAAILLLVRGLTLSDGVGFYRAVLRRVAPSDDHEVRPLHHT